MLETKRLILRQLTFDDLDVLLKHRSDKEVMKYLGGVQDRKTVKETIKVYSDVYDEKGYAFCSMFWRETNEFVGVGGLQTSKDSGETEVGYTVEKKFWGKGIATECTKACLDFGFNKIYLEKIVALTHPKNLGSIRVLEKAGMKFEKETENMNEIWVQYVILKEDYAQNKKTFAKRIYA